MTIGTCKLCDKEGTKICKSHIIPEFFYKPVYTSAKKFPVVSKSPTEKITFHQKGLRGRLLCSACETKLSRWEKELSYLTQKVNATQGSACLIYTQLSAYPVRCHHSIKMAILSIFWRMDIADDPLFKCINLGPYSDKIKKILQKESAIPISAFPIVIYKGLLYGQHLSGLIYLVDRRREGVVSIQTAVLGGLIFDLYVTDKEVLPPAVQMLQKSEGDILVPSKEFIKHGMDLASLSRRFGYSDIKDFFKKHHKP